MSETQDSPSFSATELARLVKRQVPEIQAGKPTGELVEQAIRPDEVLDYAVRGTTVVVVTTSGEKLTGELPKKAAK